MEICAICGASFSRGHTKNKHGISLREYRKRYGKKALEAEVSAVSSDNTSLVLPTKVVPVRQLKSIVDKYREQFPSELLRSVEQAMFQVTGDALNEVAGILAKDPMKYDGALAAVAVSSLQRLIRMTDAITEIEKELFRAKRIKTSKTLELVAMVQLLSVQQDRILKFLNRLYGNDPTSPFGDTHNTLVYVDGKPANVPSFLDTPEKREAAVDSVNRIVAALATVQDQRSLRIDSED